jgi:hypothetical protein
LENDINPYGKKTYNKYLEEKKPKRKLFQKFRLDFDLTQPYKSVPKMATDERKTRTQKETKPKAKHYEDNYRSLMLPR